MQTRTETKRFKVGDRAIYPKLGVAEIASIEEKDIAGVRRQFYVLRFLDGAQQNRQVLVPCDNPSQIRPPVSEAEVKEVFEILREKTVTLDPQPWNRRKRALDDKFKTGSLFDVAEVLRDLSRLRSEKPLSNGEKYMLQSARSLIVKEVAVARKKPEEKIDAEIAKILDN